MNRKHIFSALLFGTTLTASAQQTDTLHYQPYSITNLPLGAPRWMAQLDSVATVNYYAMEDSFEVYLRAFPEARRKTPRTKAIVNHFRRWQKHYYPYVQNDGRIVMPPHSDFRHYVAELNQAAAAPRAASTAVGTNGWQLLSPLNTFDYKTKKASPAQANVQRLGTSKSDPSVLYCGTETGMVFKSTDKGANWTACGGNHYFGGEISTIDVSPTNAQKVLVGAGTFVWLSTDGGNTWTDITPSQVRSRSVRVRDAAFHPSDDRQMLLGNDRGVFQTSDNGTTWAQINTGMCFDLKYKHGDANTIYVLVRKDSDMKLEISRDGGATFTPATLGENMPLACGRIGLSTAPNGRDYIYVWACRVNDYTSFTPPFYSGAPVLFKSTDGGQTWQTNTDVTTQMESIDRNGGQGYYDMVINVSPKNPEKLLFGIIQLYASNDGGRTIVNKGGYYGPFDLHCDMQDLHVVGDETWLSTDGGVIYSNDFFDKHAEARLKGIYASEFWGFDQGWNEDVMVGGRNHNGNMAQVDLYNDVAISMKGSEISTGYVFLSNPRKIAFSDAEDVILPDDWQQPFEVFGNFYPVPYESTHHGLGFEFDPRYAKSFLVIQGNWEGEHKVLWKTVNDGNSYVKLYEFSAPVTGHAISRSNPDKIVVATKGGLFRSTDGGQTFNAYASLPQEVANGIKTKVVVHPTKENELWLTTGEPGGMFRTTDDGQTWEKMDQGLSDSKTGEYYIVNRFFVTGNEKDAVYAVGSVHRSLNNGYTILRGRVLYRDNTTNGWKDYSEGLPNVLTINRMLPFYKKGKIRIATNNGIWERDLVDRQFRPIAQPLILNMGKGDEGVTELKMDSYSIVNQEKATWKWEFNPQPISISNATDRNPTVRIESNQSYDVTLTVTTPEGSDTKTVRRMIVGQKDVPSGIVGQEVLAHDILLSSHRLRHGQPLVLTPHGIDRPCEWQLYDMNGKIVQTATIAPIASTSLATQSLTAGVYFYTLNNGSFQKTGKLLIQ